MLGAVHLIPFHGFYLTRILCDSLTPAYSCFDSLRTIKQGFEGRVSLSPHEEIYRTKQDTVATQALLLTLSQGMPYSPLCIHFQPAGGSQQGGRTAAAVTPPPHQQEQPPSSSSPGEVAPTLRRARALIPAAACTTVFQEPSPAPFNASPSSRAVAPELTHPSSPRASSLIQHRSPTPNPAAAWGASSRGSAGRPFLTSVVRDGKM
jgi:hypothetical protein